MDESTARFHRGLVELRAYLLEFDEASLARAVRHLRTSARLSPGNADHWVALGFALDAREDADGALTAMRRAAALDPADEEAEVFVLTLLAEAGRESEALLAIEELAVRTEVDLESLRRDLVAAEMPVDARTLLANGFLRARSFVRSRLEDLMDRAERSNSVRDGGPEAELEDCHRRRAELEREIAPAAVPADLRHLIPWVLRLGVGDDPCRALLIEQLSAKDSAEALQDLGENASAIHAWLDAFSEGSLPPAAAAFMYTLLAAEEIKADLSDGPGDEP